MMFFFEIYIYIYTINIELNKIGNQIELQACESETNRIVQFVPNLSPNCKYFGELFFSISMF